MTRSIELQFGIKIENIKIIEQIYRLKITLATPASGSSMNEVTLGTTPADLVTGISQLAESGKTVTYKLSALTAAGVVAAAVKTVTLTIADAS